MPLSSPSFLSLLLEARSPHLGLAHALWKEHLRAGDRVFDATLGNGHDTAFVAPLVFPGGQVIAIDLQRESIEKSQKLLGDTLKELVEWEVASHATYPERLEDASLDLAIYNLGYLPGSDKRVTTLKETTLTSLSLVLKKLKSGGLLSITTYSGHPEGEEEELAIESFVAGLDKLSYRVATFGWPNRPKAPKLFLIRRGEVRSSTL